MTPSGTKRPHVRPSGFVLIATGTVVGGVASYVVTWLVPRQVGLSAYATFAMFWAFLYLVVGALFGVQQEITRATSHITRSVQRGGSARNFGFVAAAAVFAIVIVSAPLWEALVFPSDGWGLVWPLAVGTGSFVLVAVLCGSLYGVSRWWALASMLILDAFLRLATIAIVLSFTDDVVVLAWAVVIPFPAAIVFVWPFISRGLRGTTQLDVGYRALVWNVGRTVLAGASTGVMVSGFPLVLGLTSPNESRELLGLFVLSITLVRAPLIVGAMSLQSYFIVRFRDHAESFWSIFLLLQSVILAGGIVLAILAVLLGPATFAFLFPGELIPEAWFLGALVISSALVGGLCISAPAVLARSQHFVYASGWVASAIVTVVVLLLPLEFATRTVTALIVGPLVGLVVHVGYLVMSRGGPKVPPATLLAV